MHTAQSSNGRITVAGRESRALTPEPESLILSDSIKLTRTRHGAPVLAISLDANAVQKIRSELRGPISSVEALHFIRKERFLTDMRLPHGWTEQIRRFAGQDPNPTDANSDDLFTRAAFVRAILFLRKGERIPLDTSPLVVQLFGVDAQCLLSCDPPSPPDHTRLERALAGDSSQAIPKRRAARARALEDFRLYKQAWNLACRGATLPQIASAVDRVVATVGYWIKGNPPTSVEYFLQERKFKKRSQPFSFPRVESTECAFLLGAYQGSAERESEAVDQLQFRAKSDQCAALVQTAIAVTLGRQTNQRYDGEGRWTIRVGHRAAVEAFRTITRGHDRIPWELLGTPAEELAYLRGYFFYSGAVSFKETTCDTTYFPGMLVDLASLLGAHRVLGNVTLGSTRSRIQIFARPSLENLLRLGVLPSDKSAKLEAAIRRRPAGGYSVEKYDSVMAEWARSPSENDVARSTGVPTGVVRSWAIDGVRPRQVVARERLIALENRYGTPPRGVCAWLYRHCELTIEEARDLGRLSRKDEQCLERLRVLMQRSGGPLPRGVDEVRRAITGRAAPISRPIDSAMA